MMASFVDAVCRCAIQERADRTTVDRFAVVVEVRQQHSDGGGP